VVWSAAALPSSPYSLAHAVRRADAGAERELSAERSGAGKADHRQPIMANMKSEAQKFIKFYYGPTTRELRACTGGGAARPRSRREPARRKSAFSDSASKRCV